MSTELQEANRAALLASGRAVLVHEDDPTGTQTVLATGALGIRRPMVLGQLRPGVPVWRTEAGLGYVIFPANVGDRGALREAVERLN